MIIITKTVNTRFIKRNYSLDDFKWVIVTVTPSSVISASQRSLSPDSASNNFTRAEGMTVIIDPALYLILVLNVIFISLPILFSVYIFARLLYKYLTNFLTKNPYRFKY